MSIFVPPRNVEPMKAGPIGPGAGVLMTEYLMPMMLATDPQRKIRMALKLGQEVSWIRAAERVISGKIGGDPDLQGAVQWRLEDPDGEIIDENYKGDKRAIDAFYLVSQPIRLIDNDVPGDFRYSGSDDPKQVTVAEYQPELWEVTSRHMGLAGQGYWFLDNVNAFGVPAAILYVRPDRLFPDQDEKGNLIGWWLDPKNGNIKTGTHLELKEIIQFPLETPTDGFISPGLVESSILKMQLNTAIDRHLGSMIATGGRLSGMFAPKGNAIDDDGTWDQLVRDMRNLSEQPDAAKRVQLMRAPMEYTRTQATIQEMAVIDLMTKNRDDLLALWGVPLSQVGGASPSGLNSGDIRKFDEAALWQNAVVQRLVPIKQRVQRRLLRLWKPVLGWEPRLVMEIPEFDDDSPRYDKVQKAQFVALRNKERRGMLGFEPFGPDVIGTTGQPLDDEIWMPTLMQPSAMAAAPEAGNPFNNMVIVPGGAGGSMVQGMQQQGGATPTSGIPDKGPEKPSLSAIAAGSAQVPAGGAGATLKAKTVDGPDVIPAVLAALKKQWPAAELDIVRQGSWTFDPAFPIKKINASRRPVARNPKIVAGAEAVLSIGAPIAPITIIHTKRIGKPGYEPIDGWHRVLAAEHQGLKKIPAYVGEGDDAWTKELIAFDDEIPTPPDSAADEEPEGKAQTQHVTAMKTLRESVDARVTPRLRSSVASVLDEQRRSIAVRVRTMHAAIKANPRDTTIWWPKGSWDTRMTDALKPTLTDVAESVRDHVTTTYQKAGPFSGQMGEAARGAVEHVLARGAARVLGINETTRQGIADLVARGIEDGMSPAELGDAVEAWSGFDEYRAEMIARSELMDAYNAAALGSYGELGVEMVEAIDGDGDEECAARNGQTFTLEEADSIEDHPNGTLDWVPADKANLTRSPRAAMAAGLLEAIEADEHDTKKALVQIVGRFTDAMKAQAAQPITVYYTPPAIEYTPPPITVTPAPVIAPEPRVTRRIVDRDEDGNIREVREITE